MLGEIIEKLLQDEEVEKEELEKYNIESTEIYKNFVLVNEDSPIRTIDLMVSGRVHASRLAKDRQNILCKNLASPQFVSLPQLLSGRKTATCTIIANETCKFYRIPAELFEEQMLKDEKLTKIVIKYLATFSTYMIEEIALTYGYSSQYVILKYFYDVSEEKPQGEKAYVIDMNKDYLADMFHVNVRTLYRYLTSWENKGYIIREGQNIVITDESREKIYEYLERQRGNS